MILPDETGDPSVTFVIVGGAAASEVLCDDADLRNMGILMAQVSRSSWDQIDGKWKEK